MLKKTVLVFLATFLVACGGSSDRLEKEANDVFRVFLLIGQSNLEGKTVPAELLYRFYSLPGDLQYQTTKDQPAYKQTIYWVSMRDVVLGLITSAGGASFGPELEAAKLLSAGGYYPVFMSYGKSGAPLYTELRPSGTGPSVYPTIRDWYLQELPKLSAPYRVEGVIVVGGEGDANFEVPCDEADESVDEIVTTLASDLDGASIPRLSDLLVVVQSLHPDLSPARPLANINLFNKRIQEYVAADVAHRAFADISPVESPLRSDGIHIDNDPYHRVDGTGDVVAHTLFDLLRRQ